MLARGFWILNHFSDAELQGNLKELLRAAGRTEATVVAHLAEVDARRLHLRGAPSLFQYCLVELGFSESEAWYRICAARAGRRFPLVFELLERRELHLTAVALLSKYLTPENHRELLTEAKGKTKSQILELLASRWPKLDVSSHVRRIPRGAVAAGPTGTLEPRAADTYCLQLQTTRELKNKLDHARDLMSHSNPSGDLAVVVERALDVLIEKLKARRFGQTSRRAKTTPSPRRSPSPSPSRTPSPSPSPGANNTSSVLAGVTRGAADDVHDAHDAALRPRQRRHLQYEIRRLVAERDEERCCHLGLDGRRCEARAFLQFHHETPWALGGCDTADNLRLLCRAHNRLAAEMELGAERVARAIGRRRKQDNPSKTENR
jgi:hypothetical protein